MTAARLSGVGAIALLALQWTWHLALLPSQTAPPWLVATTFSLPILPSVILWLARKPSASFWGGVAALFYFCHGIAESWAVADARTLGLLEAALAVWVIVSGSWAGMRARFSRQGKPSNL